MKPIVYATSDIFVRYLLGSERNKDLLLSFLNAVQEASGFTHLASVAIKNPFNLKKIQLDKETCLDIKASDDLSRTYDVEVQNFAEGFSAGRTLYYWAKLYSDQLSESHAYHRLRPVICVNVLNFAYFREIERYHNCFLLREKTEADLILSEHLRIHFLEVNKVGDQIESSLDRWAYFLRHGHEKENETMRILIKDDPEIARMAEEYERFTRDEKLLSVHEARQKYLHDEASRMEDSMLEGRARGIAEGRAEGRAEERAEMAKKMLKRGLPIEDIRNVTGLSEEEIQKL